MNNKAFNVSLSLTENTIKIVRGLVQYDTGNLFRIKVMSGGEPFDFTGYTNIIFTILKPDGTTVIQELTTESENVQVIDRENGEVHLLIGDQGTLLVGMHFASLSFYGDGVRTTTAKLNYYVAETADQENVPDNILSSNDWAFLVDLIAKNSLIESSEAARVIAENARILAEQARAAEASGLVTLATDLSNQAQMYAEMARNWAGVAFATAIPGTYWNLTIDEDGNLYVTYDDSVDPNEYTIPAVTEEQLDARLAAIDCGVFTAAVDKVQILRGLYADLPTLAEGEMAWATDTKQMYVGSASGNELVGRTGFVAQATAPDDTTLLWIDTANNNVMKFHNGSAWTSTAVATFA